MKKLIIAMCIVLSLSSIACANVNNDTGTGVLLKNTSLDIIVFKIEWQNPPMELIKGMRALEPYFMCVAEVAPGKEYRLDLSKYPDDAIFRILIETRSWPIHRLLHNFAFELATLRSLTEVYNEECAGICWYIVEYTYRIPNFVEEEE